MNKIDAIIEELESDLEDIICQEGDSEIASGFREALCAIRIATKGMALVPVEPSTRRVQWAKFEAMNNIKPHHEGTLNHFVEFHKAMLSASQQGEG